MSNLEGLSEGKRKLLANVAMLVLLYRAPIWADAINARQYRRMEMVLVQWKAALRCVSHRGSLHVGRYTPYRDSRGRAQEGIQRDTSGQTEECKSSAGQA